MHSLLILNILDRSSQVKPALSLAVSCLLYRAGSMLLSSPHFISQDDLGISLTKNDFDRRVIHDCILAQVPSVNPLFTLKKTSTDIKTCTKEVPRSTCP